MKRVEDFNEFLSDHVNINQSRLDKLNDHVAAVTTHLSRHLESYGSRPVKWCKSSSS